MHKTTGRGNVSNKGRNRRRRLFVEILERRICLSVPAFSSLPGADHTVYLDFNGHSVESTSWNSYYNQTTLHAQPYDIDGDSGTYNATELARIEEAWKRTAEDFRPFNVNVTTVDPGIEALRQSGSGDREWGVRVIVTNESTMVNDPNEYCGCGGIAYIDSFNWSSDTPVWVYTTGGKSVAEAATHEVGHSLGLSHDGLLSGTTYYQGHGSGETGWASIMGVGYYQNVTQWDRGEYFDANNGGSSANYGDGPDDLALIVGDAGPGNGFTYRTDDHGDTDLTASPLGLSGTTLAGGGVIETTSDVDVFTFTTGAGLVTLDVDPFTPGPNLDVEADLYDGSGRLVATSNSSVVLDASFSLNLAAGQYFLHVDGTGWGTPGVDPPSGYSDYASLGQYSISGSIVDPGSLPSVSVSDASASENDATIMFTLTLSAVATSTTSVDWSTLDGSATKGSDYVAASGTATFLAGQTTASFTVSLIDDATYEGDETFTANLTNLSGLTINDSQGVGTIIDDDAEPLPTVSIVDASANEGKLNTKGKNAGTAQLTDMIFTVTLSAASTQTVTVDYATSDGTATVADSDFQTTSGTVAFIPGETSRTVRVAIVGDNTQEGDETFSVDLSNASNADIAAGSATGTIIDDDSGTKGGGNGGGKGGGKPNKSPSEESPIVIVDPIWLFEEPEGLYDHDRWHDHDELHADHQKPLGTCGNPTDVLAGAKQSVELELDSTRGGEQISIDEVVDLVVAQDAFVSEIMVQESPLVVQWDPAETEDSFLDADLLDQMLDSFSLEMAELV